jgi:transcriptional regulator with XRE-family HTH domain
MVGSVFHNFAISVNKGAAILAVSDVQGYDFDFSGLTTYGRDSLTTHRDSMPDTEPDTSALFLSTRIINAREASGFTQAQLALRMGIKKSTVANWESSRTSPRANKLIELSGILNVPVLWLIAGAESPAEVTAPELSETLMLEQKLDKADILVNELSAIISDLRGHTRRVQRDINESH